MESRKILVGVFSAIVIAASLAKVGLGTWKLLRRDESGPLYVGYYVPGGTKEIPSADDKKVQVGEAPLVGSADFEAAEVAPLVLKTTELDPGSTYFSIVLSPRPEAAARIASNRATPVLVVLDGRAGSSVPAPLGDFDVQGRLLLASFPDEGSAKLVLARVVAGLEKKL